MTDVSSSSARYSIKSISDKSALFPRLTNFENPTFEPIAQSSIAVHNAPDWEKNAIRPFGGIPFAFCAGFFETGRYNYCSLYLFFSAIIKRRWYKFWRDYDNREVYCAIYLF